MVTHHPLAIAELEKGQIQVMARDSNFQVHSHEPEESPRGMGYAGILTSDMFGLRTTLDSPTEDLIRARRAIIEKDDLTEGDKVSLSKLDAELEKLGFTTAHWDNDYREYLILRHSLEREHDEQMPSSPEDQEKRKAIAGQIVKKILSEGVAAEGRNARD